MKFVIHLTFSTLFLFQTCMGEPVINNFTHRRQQVFEEFCNVLKDASNWLSVVFKIKSVWTDSTIRHIAEDVKTKAFQVNGNLPIQPSPKQGDSSTCSLTAVFGIFHSYINLQLQILRLKAILSTNLLRATKLRLDGASITLKERMKTLDVVNETSTDLFEKLKLSAQALIQIGFQNPVTENRFMKRKLEERPSLFKILQTQTNNMFLHMLEDIRKNRAGKPSLGEFVQAFGRTLDKYLQHTFPEVSNFTVKNETVIENETISEKDVQLRYLS